MMPSRVIMVTGASRGIGLAIAKRLAAKDVALVVTYQNKSFSGLKDLEDELSPLCQAFEAKAFSVGDSEEAGKAVSDIVGTYGRLDVLVNNAGITRDGLSVRMSDDDFSEVIRVNLLGAFYMSRPAAKFMMRQRQGKIINVASVVAFTGNPGQVNYAAS
ncbi:MAG: SDR family NAD(P)-dependent oxidoreductase, partial [Deltaproteobacteria bacterium]|nr:SDR family NAD(P)-dependent oxidoreductase [Deltaproteobacteria bacterium]